MNAFVRNLSNMSALTAMRGFVDASSPVENRVSYGDEPTFDPLRLDFVQAERLTALLDGDCFWAGVRKPVSVMLCAYWGNTYFMDDNLTLWGEYEGYLTPVVVGWFDVGVNGFLPEFLAKWDTLDDDDHDYLSNYLEVEI